MGWQPKDRHGRSLLKKDRRAYCLGPLSRASLLEQSFGGDHIFLEFISWLLTFSVYTVLNFLSANNKNPNLHRGIVSRVVLVIDCFTIVVSCFDRSTILFFFFAVCFSLMDRAFYLLHGVPLLDISAHCVWATSVD